MKKWIALALLGIMSYGVFFVINTPAQQALSFIGPSKEAPFSIFGVQGTLFNGQAETAYFGPWEVAQMDWSISPVKLLMGSIGADISGRIMGGKTVFNVNLPTLGSLNGMTLSDLSSEMDVAQLQSRLVPGRPPVRFAGALSFQMDEFSLTEKGNPKSAKGLILWNNASIDAQTPIPLGDFALRFTPASGGFKGVLQNVDDKGPLLVNVEFNVVDNGAVTVKGSIRPGPSAGAEIKQALAFKADNTGTVNLSTSFNLNDAGSIERAKRQLL